LTLINFPKVSYTIYYY